DGDSPEIAQEEDPWRRGIVSGTTPEDTGEDLSRRNASLTSSPVAKRVNFSPMSSPRIGQRCASLSPSSSRNRPNSLKNLVPKLSFKNRNSDVEKADDLAFEGNVRDRSTWTLSNILTPRLKKTESLPVTPLAHSNPGSTHGRYVADPVTTMKKGPPLPIHRSRSVPAFNKDGSLRQAVLVIVSMLAYFCFLEQLLLTKMKSGAIAISLPFSCVLGLLASMTTTTMVKKQYIWIYATVQFGLVVFFSHIFFSLVHMKPVVSILLATLVGFGLTMSGQTGIAEFAKWRRVQRTTEPPSSSPVQTAG
ncbi:hypothetical protein F2Q69_00003138, partial [Brassica cretica]